MIAAVVCDLVSSSCASNLWVERHSVPVTCLSHSWVPLVLSLRLAAVWLSFHLDWRVAALSYVPEFLAKTETAVRPLPRSFSIQSLQDFAAGLPEDILLCPVRSSREYLRRTSGFVNWPRRLFISTSSAFFKNWSISSVLEAASWKSNTVFTSFYFRDLQYVFEGVRSLGPFVAAGEHIG